MDPVTLTIAAAGVSAIGKVLGGIGANSAAKARARALRQSATMDLEEAGLAASLGLEEDERVQGQLAVQAASGVGGGPGGSALAVLDDLKRQSLLKARGAVYRGRTSAWRNLNDAAVTRAQGRYALASSVFSAGSTMLSSFASASTMKGG